MIAVISVNQHVKFNISTIESIFIQNCFELLLCYKAVSILVYSGKSIMDTKMRSLCKSLTKKLHAFFNLEIKLKGFHIEVSGLRSEIVQSIIVVVEIICFSVA